MFQHRNSWYLGICAYWFATALKWFLILILMPGRINELAPRDLQNTYWGIVLTIGAVEACIGPAVMGWWSDRVGRRFNFIISGALLTLAACGVLVFAPSIWVLALGYLMLQIADDVATGPYSALIPQLVPSEHRGKAASVMGMYQSLANILGAAGVAWLGGQFVLFMVILAIVHLVAMTVVLRTAGKDPGHSTQEELSGQTPIQEIFEGIKELWKNLNFRWVWLTRFLVAMGASILVSFGNNFLKDEIKVFRIGTFELKTEVEAAGILIVAMAFTSFVGAMLGGRVADRTDRRKVAAIAGMIMFLAMLPFAFIDRYGTLVAVAMIYGIGNGVYMSADWALAADVLPDPDSFGKDLGIWQSSIAVPQLFVGLVGALIDMINRIRPGTGYGVAFAISASLFLLSSVLVRKVQLTSAS